MENVFRIGPERDISRDGDSRTKGRSAAVDVIWRHQRPVEFGGAWRIDNGADLDQFGFDLRWHLRLRDPGCQHAGY